MPSTSMIVDSDPPSMGESGPSTPASAGRLPRRLDNPQNDVGTWAGLRGRSVDLPAYNGPLDLLLKLIRKNEVDIYDIPIAAITEEYVAEIEVLERRDLAIAGDFLLMAATLIEIKSAMMLPRPPVLGGEEDLDPRAELVERLLEYQAFRAAAVELGRLEGQRRLLFSRPFSPSAIRDYGARAPVASNLTITGLSRSLAALLKRLDDEGEPVTSIPRERISLRLRIAQVQAELLGSGNRGLLLEELARPSEGRLAVIVTFLAILELIRSGKVWVREALGGATHRIGLVRLQKGDPGREDHSTPDER